MRRYFRNVFVGFDQLLNTFAGGSPDETCSSRLWRYRDNKIGNFFRKVVDWIALKVFKQENHCKSCVEPDDHHKEDVVK